jgi:Tol biopolymer transport system component
MNLPHDPQIAAWLAAGAAERSPEPLARALAATRRTRKRPRWTFPERWLPVQLTMSRTPSLRPIFAIVSVALLIVTLVATALYVGSRPPVPPPLRNGAVVYAEDGDLFIADQLGDTPRLLMTAGTAMLPAFSPNGDRVAFTAPGLSEGSLVFTVRPDGTDLKELAGWDGWSGRHLRWAPDGSALAVTSNGIFVDGAGGTGPGTWQLAVVAADGSGHRMVDAGPGTNAGPAEWRPDGRLIAFVGYTSPTRTRDVFLADRDGTNVRRIPDAANVASDGVAWSPDGSRLAFMHHRADRTVEIVVLDLDADGRVTGSKSIGPEPQVPARQPPPPPVEAELTPRWSPDGSRLAYAAVDGWTLRIGTVASDGSGSRIVGASDAAGTVDVDWSPDGRSLVVVRRDADSRIGYLLDPATGKKISAEFQIGDWQGLAP